ncbi:MULTISPECIES: aminotransferase class I/II-fold pyridoxal phosphate-dependent enzyme [unclassified Streptomyces]|uniref:aminotransferase class I/II-fold pyridoxal phosphate-dependent enzyme n=1 Tax=unclassified Streptomyces TaxID=2593676 RepID=UPI00224DF6C0|nr:MULTISPECIES: aminotransferase class I/II-fold pyridoxal phosphate-dependent enzyme [unclassified Streptomyces]MCX5055167.1 aminotransferase class I/II-fold pyridoxal phosphate-dependent enzyme [Streptomyces sp. NBC_00474]MCX5058675.1 aminotransferase class I/II-fold pyridoxal phosphate-dependent enzyme [Streptomyces sp. NBC_00452]MCX5244445.1 aminotransferase class I/II-fold pyridoxal phosphate-dependent enzyme [Streptomyces sp. NBC_00201]MCX5289823.1 aminotransferase class I/II-fold pyrido
MLEGYRIEGRRAAEIASSVERAVGSGELEPGQLLPPMRELAVELGVNANTVASAYRILRERGVIETAGRRGSRVRSKPATTGRDYARMDVPEGVRDVANGNPDPALLPSLAKAFAAAGEQGDREPVLYGDALVEPELARIARAALDADGVPEGPLTVASGSLDAIERVLAAHLKPGDTVAVEDPGWGSLLDLVPAVGLRTAPVGVDDEGPLPSDVRRALEAGARALIVTDRAQNPTGAAVTATRARALRAVLREHPETLLVEDDHGHGIVDLPLHPLAGVTRHWAFVRSVAKAYGPDLRLAVLTGDPVTVDRVAGRHRLGPGWVSRITQRAVVRLWADGVLDTRTVAAAYRNRRDLLIDALAQRGVEAHGRSGLNVWIPVPDETGAVARLLHGGWAVAPGARFRMSARPGIRITVATLAPEEVGPLADAIAEALVPPPTRTYV